MEAPERIWVSPEHPDENGYGGFWIRSRVAPSVEYIRADLLEARIGAAEKRGEEKWFADAKLMLGFAELAYAAGAKPSSSELIAAEQRVLDRVRREARVEAFEEVARLVDCGCHPEKKAVTLSFEPGHWRMCSEVNCGALEANAIRALIEAERGEL